MSLNVEFGPKEVNTILLTNILKMFERRGYIKSWEDELKKIDQSLTIIDIKNGDKHYSSLILLMVNYHLLIKINN
jgi:ribosomal protein S8